METNISRKISCFKWLLTLGMVMYHARWTYGYNLSYHSLADRILLEGYVKFAEHLGFVCMVFFFFVSGFFLYYKANTLKELMVKAGKRVKTLLIPFVLWNIVVALYQCFIGSLDISFDKLCDYFFFKPLAGPLWYLMALLVMMVVFAPLMVKFRSCKKLNTFLFLVVIVYSFLKGFQVIDPVFSYARWWWYPNLWNYLSFYMIGGYVGMYYPQIITTYKYENRVSAIIGAVLVFVSTILWIVSDNSMFYTTFALIEIIGLWLLVKERWFKKKLPDYYSCAFYIYALHNPIYIPKFNEYMQRLLSGTAINGYEMILVKILQVLCIVGVSYCLSIIVKKVFSKAIYEGLTGGR